MTEDEAKTRWCPFVRFHVEGKAPTFTATPNREQRGTRCIGAACMAWRVVTGMGKTRVHPSVLDKHWLGWNVTDATPDERGFVEITPPPQASVGFCGLAGAPQ